MVSRSLESVLMLHVKWNYNSNAFISIGLILNSEK